MKTVIDTLREYEKELVELAKKGVNTYDVKYLTMYEDYTVLRKNRGWKVLHLYEYLAKKYALSVSSVRRILKRLAQ